MTLHLDARDLKLDPTAVTEMTGLTPTRAIKAGTKRLPNGPMIEHNIWSLRCESTPDTAELEEQATALAELLKGYESRLSELAKNCRWQFTVTIMTDDYCPGIMFPTAFVALAARIGASIEVDVMGCGSGKEVVFKVADREHPGEMKDTPMRRAKWSDVKERFSR